MPSATAVPSSSPELPFRYVGGDPSLDLVNTVDWTARGLESERLSSSERLIEWAAGAGVVSALDAEGLRRRARERPREAAAALAEARRLRGVLQEVFVEVAGGSPGPVLDAFNEYLGGALRRLRLTSSPRRHGRGRAADWAWQGAGEDLRSLLWPVVWRAAALLTSEEAGKVRVCAGPGCGWMYVDRSRNRLRRWCQMETCGTREKSRRRAVRSRRAKNGKR